MAKVAFISHASEDAAIAAIVTEHLERKGIFCWIAPRDVTPGSNYSTEIVGAIEAGAVFVLILSENANKSLFVMREVERAVSKGKPVFPIRVREVTPSPSLELFISSAHWIDAWQPPLEKHLEQLAQSISSVAAVQVPTPKPAGVGDLSPRLRRFLSIAIAATVLLVLGGVAGMRTLVKKLPGCAVLTRTLGMETISRLLLENEKNCTSRWTVSTKVG